MPDWQPSATEAIAWLALPTPTRRDYVLYLDPRHLLGIRGPQRILLGGRLEYILASGFPIEQGDDPRLVHLQTGMSLTTPRDAH